MAGCKQRILDQIDNPVECYDGTLMRTPSAPPIPEGTGKRQHSRRTSQTGNGKIKVLSCDDIHFALYNFDINGFELKPEHKQQLRCVASRLKGPGFVTLRGLTSRTGSQWHNQKLAERRVDSVKRYLMSTGVSPGVEVFGEKRVRFLQPDIIGEKHGLTGVREDEFHRAVWVRFIGIEPPPARQPQRSPSVSKEDLHTAKRFKVQVIKGEKISRAIGLALSITFKFEAVSKEAIGESWLYDYLGVGFTIPPGMSVGSISQGKWSKEFAVEKPVDVRSLGPIFVTLRTSTFEPDEERPVTIEFAKLFARDSFIGQEFTIEMIHFGEQFRPSLFGVFGNLIPRDKK